MANGLEWAGQSAFFAAPLEPLLLGGLEAGQVKKSGLLTFVQIEAAGHMVPMDQAAASAWVINDLLATVAAGSNSAAA
jgi:carboxypeptidase C (cathepsin A)